MEELSTWRQERGRYDDRIRKREEEMQEWYSATDRQNLWVEAGSQRFRVMQTPGRRTLNKEGLAQELEEIFQFEGGGGGRH